MKRANKRRKRGLGRISRSVTRTREASAREEKIASFRTGPNRRTAAVAAAVLPCATRTKEVNAPEVILANFHTKKVVVVVRDRRREVLVVAVASALHF